MARLLVLTDHPDTRQTLERFLSREGHELVLAPDTTPGIELYRAHRPGVVIVDVFMKTRDGIETIAGLRREFPSAKIVAVSAPFRIRGLENTDADNEIDVLADARQSGANVALLKPVDPAFLATTIHQLLDDAGGMHGQGDGRRASCA